MSATTVSPRLPTVRRAMLIGLIGNGVAPSLTPPIHQLEGARHGMHYVYRAIELRDGETSREQIGELLDAAKRLGFNGLNITHPIKQTVIPLLDELSASAQRVGAVNTVVFEAGRMVGHNTDVTGFGAALDDVLPGTGPKLVVLLGAGGAGAAVASALTARGVDDLVIVDVDTERAGALAAAVGAGHSGRVRTARLADLTRLLADADGVVNATPRGMAAHPGAAFDLDLLTERLFVADIVYRPVETALLAGARARGCTVMSGLGMAMHQAADAFEIFTGEPADRRAMLADLETLVAAEATAPPAHVAPIRGEV